MEPNRFFPLRLHPSEHSSPRWLRIAKEFFPAWSLTPALILMMLDLVPEHSFRDMVYNIGATNLLPVVAFFDGQFQPLAGILVEALRPDVYIWLKATPPDLILGAYLVSMTWGIVSIAVLLLTVKMDGPPHPEVCSLAMVTDVGHNSKDFKLRLGK